MTQAQTQYVTDIDLALTMTDEGRGRPALVLHGGGGPATVAAISAHLGKTMRVLTPTHPGWNGTPRPERLDGIDDLASLYLRHLAAQGLRDVLVVGSSIGGWLAAEMASRDDAGLIGGLVLINAVGVDIEGEPITDFFSLDPRGIAEHCYFDPDRFYVDPASVPPERAALQRGNIATLKVLAGDRMYDPTLLARLRNVHAPTLVLWGEADRIVTPGYGLAFASGFPNARFEIVPRAGHLPQLEQPDATFALIDGFRAEAGMAG